MTMTDMLRTSPEQFDEDLDILLMEQVERKYTNKILPGSGLGIAFYDFIELGDPFVYPAEGESAREVMNESQFDFPSSFHPLLIF